MEEIVELLSEQLTSRLEIEEVQYIAGLLRVILNDYSIERKCTDIVPYNGNANEAVIKKFLAVKMVQGCSQRTLTYYKTILDSFCEKMQKHLTNITTDDLLYYLAVRKTVDQVTECTQDNELRVLRSFYCWAAANDMIAKDPTRTVHRVKTKKKVKLAFTEKELELMRSACVNKDATTDYKELAIIETLLSTGCRASELCSIKISDIEGDSIKILGKGNKERMVYINARAEIAIQNYLKTHERHTDYLFYGYSIKDRTATDRMIPGTVNVITKRVAKRAGITECHAHKFRRTAATLALKRGMPIELVSKMLGHESIATTQIYLQLTDDDLKNAHKKYC